MPVGLEQWRGQLIFAGMGRSVLRKMRCRRLSARLNLGKTTMTVRIGTLVRDRAGAARRGIVVPCTYKLQDGVSLFELDATGWPWAPRRSRVKSEVTS